MPNQVLSEEDSTLSWLVVNSEVNLELNSLLKVRVVKVEMPLVKGKLSSDPTFLKLLYLLYWLPVNWWLEC